MAKVIVGNYMVKQVGVSPDGSIKYEQDEKGQAPCIEYTNNGIEERVIIFNVNLGLGIETHVMETVIERKGTDEEWYKIQIKRESTSKSVYVDASGEVIENPFEEVKDKDHEKFKADGNSYSFKKYYTKQVLKEGVMSQNQHLTTTLGEPALFPYLKGVLIKNNDLEVK